MNLIDILKLYGFDPATKTRLVRHADNRYDLDLIHRGGWMDEYQARQGRDVFGRCLQIVSFMGERGTRSRLLGVYTVKGCTKSIPPWQPGFPYPTMNPGTYYYDLDKLPQYAELEERLIIGWGASTRSWVQRVKPDVPKLIVELLPKGYVMEFPGYDDIHIRFGELESIVHHREANRAWHKTLAAVAGVYLICDGVDGSLYVGSASGESGIFGRWATYAKTPHGGNKMLRELLAQHPGRHKEFTFSVLRTLPKTMTQKEVVEVECAYKRKLGKRACSLNGN